MNEEVKLPDDLQMAYEFARAVWPVAGTTADKRMSASDAIRTEHAQRLTLQHHACDLAQRVADLEAERDEAQQAIAEARADGAREMRDVAAAAGYASAAERDGHKVFDAILALPLPAKREPVLLTDGEAMDALPDCHGASLGKTWLLSAARAIEAAVLAANGLTK